MGPLKAIKIALDTYLSTLDGDNVFAWENVPFNPTLNTPYIRPSLVPSPAALSTVDGAQVHRGFYQIDLYFPVNRGVAAILTKMDDIYNHFKINDSIEQDSYEILIRAVSGLRLVTQESYVQGTIQIDYECYSN